GRCSFVSTARCWPTWTETWCSTTRGSSRRALPSRTRASSLRGVRPWPGIARPAGCLRSRPRPAAGAARSGSPRPWPPPRPPPPPGRGAAVGWGRGRRFRFTVPATAEGRGGFWRGGKPLELRGTAELEGLATAQPARGTLDLAPLLRRELVYELEFCSDRGEP